MVTTLRESRVASLTVTVWVAPTLGGEPHDVYLLEVPLPRGSGAGGQGFDEAPVLADLETVLDAAGPHPEWAVEVSRTHRSDEGARGLAQVSVLIASLTDAPTLGAEPDLTVAVQDAFTRILARSAPPPADALSHDAALAEAKAAVARLTPDLGSRQLALTDEEHHPAEGSWMLGLALPGVARFRVRVGLVGAAPRSVHVRRMPVAEVVDSVGP